MNTSLAVCGHNRRFSNKNYACINKDCVNYHDIHGLHFPRNQAPILGLINLLQKQDMNNTPTPPAQAVTERYTNNLIRNGQNDEFRLIMINSTENTAPDETFIGYIFEAVINAPTDRRTYSAYGATPSQAVRRALKKFGVTFR